MSAVRVNFTPENDALKKRLSLLSFSHFCGGRAGIISRGERRQSVGGPWKKGSGVEVGRNWELIPTFLYVTIDAILLKNHFERH